MQALVNPAPRFGGDRMILRGIDSRTAIERPCALRQAGARDSWMQRCRMKRAAIDPPFRDHKKNTGTGPVYFHSVRETRNRQTP